MLLLTIYIMILISICDLKILLKMKTKNSYIFLEFEIINNLQMSIIYIY